MMLFWVFDLDYLSFRYLCNVWKTSFGHFELQAVFCLKFNVMHGALLLILLNMYLKCIFQWTITYSNPCIN